MLTPGNSAVLGDSEYSKHGISTLKACYHALSVSCAGLILDRARNASPRDELNAVGFASSGNNQSQLRRRTAVLGVVLPQVHPQKKDLPIHLLSRRRLHVSHAQHERDSCHCHKAANDGTNDEGLPFDHSCFT
jgi:hypothetical protein